MGLSVSLGNIRVRKTKGTYFFCLAREDWIFWKLRSSELNLKVRGSFSSSSYRFLSIS
jgi:hypothetical protein